LESPDLDHAAGGSTAGGVVQIVNALAGDTGSAVISNNGALDINAIASAVATGTAVAGATVNGVVQEAFGRNGGAATVSVANGTAGAIDITASAKASGGVAVGTTTIATGTGTGVVTLPVPGAAASVVGIHQVASATGTRTTVVGAGATATTVTVGGTAIASVANSGTINVAANATASGTGAGWALANASGIVQTAIGTGGVASVSNAGSINVSAVANAVAPAPATGSTLATGPLTGVAIASANALGIAQVADATASVINSGALSVLASANAAGATAAVANASAVGVSQNAPAVGFANSGTVNVTAVANAAGVPFNTATGTATTATGMTATTPVAASASANAVGYVANGVMAASVTNSGTMNVNATAAAPGTAVAAAQGIVLNAPTTVTTVGTGTTAVTTVNGKALVANITNSGTLNVVANAAGGVTQTSVVTGTGTTATTVVTTHPHSSAIATGIRLNAGLYGTTSTTTPAGSTTPVVHHNNTTITNSGTIDVRAITANGGPAQAYGIRVTSNGAATPAAGQVLTINNSGDISALYSTDGGTTFHRGEAIDVSAAPVASTVINLLGGSVTGNIELQSDADVINATTGTTLFNGVVNNNLCGAFVGAITLDDPAQNDCGVGTLNINGGGNLELAIDAVDGPSYVFMDTLNMGADGTITFDLPAATGGTVPLGTYPQVFVDTANLAGTLVANIASPNGLYETTTYQNVIDAIGPANADGSLTTHFDQCLINGVPADSLLIGLSCVYDDQANVDLAVTRAPFNSVAGINGNAGAVASGLASVYNVNLTGGAANMFADLFQFTNAANYNVALNQLSGSVYANYLQSFPSLGVHENDLTDHATNCEIPALAGSVLECRASSPIHVWGQLDYQTRKADGDIEAGTTRSKRFTGLLGVDATVANSAIVGIDAGYLTNHVRDNQFGDTAKGEGWTAGAYAVYDPGSFYLKGVTTYSDLNGKSRRHIDFSGLATGASFAATPTGSPDAKMWTFGLHGGARLATGAASVFTPYLNYDYVNAKLKGFSEDGGNGAELTVDHGHSNHSFLTGGVKWATQLGGVVPELNVGYRYRFGNERSSVHTYFTSDPENDFDIVSAAQKKGTFLAGLSVGGKIGAVDVRIGYEGEFNGDVTSHSGNFKFVLPLGGHKAAPPPPPPPAPVMAPPPPPPPPAPERGQ
jgi:uncharacterized protein with beta-barrel porin domain